MSDIGPDNRPLIQQLNFQEGGVEVVYLEARDAELQARTGILNTRVKSIPARYIEAELADLMDSIVAVLDAAGGAERDAPQTFRR